MSTLIAIRRGCVALLACVTAADAQLPAAPPRVDVLTAGGEWERYARVLQLAQAAGAVPWSIRAFGPDQVTLLQPTDTTHPWQGRYRPWAADGRRSLGVVAPEARLGYNSAFPFGLNDGAVWAGRGVTAVVAGGVAARLGPLSIVAAPTFFAAQNQSFELIPMTGSGPTQLRDGQISSIDRPQRFGYGTYARLDWGQSTARIDLAGAAIGISSANEFWGPAVDHPLLLGNNAGGFAHAFAGTSRPVDVGIGRIQARIIWGRLEQSAYALIRDTVRVRLGTGLVATFTPRGVPGLELGGARFFHTPWPDDGLTGAHLAKPFEGILKRQLATEENPNGDMPGDNQLASVFARWVFPRSGVEVYGEYAREDHSWDARDFWLEPDHISAYLVGLQRVWKSDDRYIVGRAEMANSRVSHLAQVRGQTVMYMHSDLWQGHTHRGQVLGSAGIPGGGAAVLAADMYHPGGRWTASWSRIMRAEFQQPEESGLPDPERADVMHALAVDGVLFRRRADLLGGVTLVQNLNRDFARDAFNLNLSLGARARW